jgi:hypothetical protein
MVYKLLLRGCSPNEEVAIGFFHEHWESFSQTTRSSTTMWIAFCIHLLTSLDRWWVPGRAEEGLGVFLSESRIADFQILELLLEAGANPDANFKSTPGLKDDPSTWRRGADISLRQFVLWAGPPNKDRLMGLMERKPASPTAETAVSEPSEPHGWDYFEGFEVIEQTVTCGDETIEYGGPSSGKPRLELALW